MPVAESNVLTHAEARERARVISDVTYSVHLDLTDDEVYVTDTTVAFTADGDRSFIDIVARSVREMTLNGDPIPSESFRDCRISLEHLGQRNELRIVAECGYSNTGMGLHRFVDPVDGLVYLYTDHPPFDAHRTFPCFDQPDIKATFELSVLAPAGSIVVSNCKAIERPDPGESGVWRFERTPPVSTYLCVMCAGPWHEVHDRHNGIALGIYCRRSLAEHLDADEIFEITKAGFDHYHKKFEYPYMIDKYDHVFCPQYNAGAMENFGCITVTEAYIFRSKVTDSSLEARADTILHELAHMWFGDLVTMRWWEDLWLNESFATYQSMVAMTEATVYAHAWTTFANGWKPWAYNADQLTTTHPIKTAMSDTDSVGANFDGIAYAKGCSVLRQLAVWVGEEAFDEALRLYFKEHEWGNAELSDFLRALEKASGKELSRWSDVWLEAAGVNTLSPGFDTQGGTFTSFRIDQTAPDDWPVLRPHKMAVGLYDRDGSSIRRRSRFDVEIDGETTEIPDLVGQKVPDLVLLNDEDLTYAKIRFDPRSLETVIEAIGDVDDGLARVLCWSAVWDMVRDAEAGASKYLDMIVANLPRETNGSVIDSILAKCALAVASFIAPSKLSAARSKLARAALETARKAEGGSGIQLSWARTFIGQAREEPHLQLLRSWLEGKEVPDGLAIDADLRWAIVGGLAGAGAGDQDLIDREAERDPTETGRLRAAGARAAMPDAAVKDETFKAIVEDLSLPLAVARAMMPGVSSLVDQRDLLRPFVPRYFAALDHIASVRDTEVASALADGLFPGAVTEEATIAACDEYLSGSPPSHLARKVREGKDRVIRALAAQARDAEG